MATEPSPLAHPQPLPPLRARQPGVTRDGLDRAVARLDAQRRTPCAYGPHLRAWLARYSRGEAIDALRAGEDGLDGVVAQVVRDGEEERARFGAGTFVFACGTGWIGRYRDGLVLLSLCLALDRADLARAVLDVTERGDPLVEALSQALGPAAGQAPARRPPAFPEAFAGLLRALDAPGPEAAAAIAGELPHWLDERMAGFGFVDSDTGLGYWCFEAAGVVLARGIDDATFRDHPHYPADLVTWARRQERAPS